MSEEAQLDIDLLQQEINDNNYQIRVLESRNDYLKREINKIITTEKSKSDE